MPQVSAGLLMIAPDGRFLLVHPGGPFFKNKDAGSWSIPKGLADPDEDLLVAAIREFQEETGWTLEKKQELIALDSVQQKGGKVVHAWAFVGERDPETLKSNEFELEWPPRSGKKRRFPEVDRAGLFTLDEARDKIVAAQMPFLERAIERSPPFAK